MNTPEHMLENTNQHVKNSVDSLSVEASLAEASLQKNYHSDFTCQYYSKNDFLRLIVSRIKKDIRLQGTIDFEKKYYLDTTTQGKLAHALLTHAFSETFHYTTQQNEDGVITLSTILLEDYLCQHLDVFFKQQPLTFLRAQQLNVLRTISYEEAEQLLIIFAIEGTLEKPATPFIDALQEKYKQTKPSLLKSFLYLEQKMSEE